jgi:hypothetical protein
MVKFTPNHLELSVISRIGTGVFFPRTKARVSILCGIGIKMFRPMTFEKTNYKRLQKTSGRG